METRNRITREREKKKANVIAETEALVKELNILKDVNDIMTMANGAGKRFILWLMDITSPIGKGPDQSKTQLYALQGKQEIGRRILRKVVESGHDLKITDISHNLNTNKINSLYDQIKEKKDKITKEDKK
jgi:hypothetical protein